MRHSSRRDALNSFILIFDFLFLLLFKFHFPKRTYLIRLIGEHFTVDALCQTTVPAPVYFISQTSHRFFYFIFFIFFFWFHLNSFLLFFFKRSYIFTVRARQVSFSLPEAIILTISTTAASLLKINMCM